MLPSRSDEQPTSGSEMAGTPVVGMAQMDTLLAGELKMSSGAHDRELSSTPGEHQNELTLILDPPPDAC